MSLAGAEETVGAVLDQDQPEVIAKGPEARTVLRKTEVVDGDEGLAGFIQPGFQVGLIDAQVRVQPIEAGLEPEPL